MNEIPPHDFTLSVNIPIATTEALRDTLASLQNTPLAELWLAHSVSGQSVAVYKNASRAFVMFLSTNRDTALHASDPHYAGSPDQVLPIYMANGQGDEQPMSETVPTDHAYSALIHFCEHLSPTTQLSWVSD